MASSLKRQAKSLGKSKYAPVYEQIAANRRSNRSAYDTGTAQRLSSLDRELGSISAANTATQQVLDSLNANTGTAYQQAVAQSQKDNEARQASLNKTNSNLLSSLDSERIARGLDPIYSNSTSFASDISKKNEILTALQSISEGSMSRQRALSGDMFASMKGSSDMLNTTSMSSAKGTAQKTLDEMYATYLKTRQELEAQKTVTKKEQGDYINQTYLTLKDRAEQKRAAKAAAAASSAIAQGNLAYKYDSLNTRTQLEYDKLAQKKSLADITNKFKKAGLKADAAKEAARQALAGEKFNFEKYKFDWKTKNPQVSAVQSLIDAINSGAIK